MGEATTDARKYTNPFGLRSLYRGNDNTPLIG